MLLARQFILLTVEAASTSLVYDIPMTLERKSVSIPGSDRTVTVLFEEVILVILPTAIFLALSPFRMWALVRRRIWLRPNNVFLIKIVRMPSAIPY